MAQSLDPDFLALGAGELAAAALERAGRSHVSHADARVERIRTELLVLRDGKVETTTEGEILGIGVRVVAGGSWGFAAGWQLDAGEAARLADAAIEAAGIARTLSTERIELAPEPVHRDATWVSACEIDPFDVPGAEKASRLAEWSRQLLAHPAVDHVEATFQAAKENKLYADLAGTTTCQQRTRVHCALSAHNVDPVSGELQSMRTLAPPVGRGYEHLTGTGWDFASELAQLPDLLAEKAAAPSVEAGTYDLVIDPSNLWLTIHESIGHATELDRALGYEANYAGTSFATPDKLGSLRYGSPLMNVTGDRTVEHGLASIGYDDDGVATGSWDLVRDGMLVGYQLDRRMARLAGAERSNGCAFADSPFHMPLQRMANVSLQPQPGGPSTDELISGVRRGLYIMGDGSWSIDMQRYNFQFTGQRFYAIRNGRLAGQVRDVAYQSSTPEFWGSLQGLGGEQTWVLGGAFNCGKGQPGQIAPVSHGCPSALFRNVRVLNTKAEAAR